MFTTVIINDYLKLNVEIIPLNLLLLEGMISKKFLTSSLIYSIVGALPMLSGFVLLPFYTSDLLSEKNYGYLALHLSFTLLFQSIIILCLENFVGTVIFESKHNRSELKKKISSINYYSLLFSGMAIALMLVIGPFIFEFSFKEAAPLQFYPFILCTVLTSFFNAYFKLYCNQLIYTEQPKQYLFSNVVNFIATIVISIIGLYFYGDSIMGPLMGRLLSGITIFIIAFYHLKKQYGLKSDPKFLVDIKRFCIPLVIYCILNWVFNYADRLFIEKMLSTELVGLFDFGIKCTLGIEILFTGMNHSIYPKIYALIKENASPEKLKEHINKYASGYLMVIILAIAFTLITVPFAVDVLIKKTFYHKALAFLAILAIGQLFKVLYYIYISPLYYLKRTDLVAKSFVFATIIQLILVFTLTYFWKLNGIIIAYILSKPFQIWFVYRESNRFIHFPINIIKQIFLPVILIIVVFSFQLLIVNNQALYYNPMLGFIILTIAFIFYRNEAMPFLKSIQRKIK